MILVLDNRDSFVFNLAQALAELGAEPLVVRSTELGWRDVARLEPRGVLIGPGPGRPAGAGCSEDVVRELGPHLPVLGVCLGHQSVATALGGRLIPAPELCHGSTRALSHDGTGVLAGLPSPVQVTHYHSLAVDPDALPGALVVSGRGEHGEVLALRHREHPVEGVQFHPESVLCLEAVGRALLANFVARCG